MEQDKNSKDIGLVRSAKSHGAGNYATSIDRREICFKNYIEDMERFPVLSNSEQMELLTIIHSNSKESDKARQRLIECNMRMVVSVAMLLEENSLDLNDLISEGNIGLIEAIDRYDISKGQKFSAYAAYWIKKKLIEAIRDYNSIGGVKEKKNARNQNTNIESIDNCINKEDDGMTYCDALIDEKETDDKMMLSSKQRDIRCVLSHILSDDELVTILGRFGIGQHEQTKTEIAAALGVGKERVRQLYENAIKKIRQSELKSILLR